ncbi:MAG: dicarboxylate/amino acid:cation symporter, partial [Idiomarina sp.]|nr:dicarboxylate/amino acid:cation symporter [Idiomarina sp.]
GIASLPNNSGKMLGKTLGIAYLSTVCAGIVAFFAASLVVTWLTTEGQTAPSDVKTVLEPFITLDVPPALSVMSALVLAFIFGLGIASTGSQQLKTLSDQGRDIIERLLVKVIIPLLPFYIAGVFAEMAVAGTVFSTLKTFGVILLLAVALHWVYITFMFIIAGLKSGRSPLMLIRNMLPAYFTALGTMSSAATIPVTLQSVRNNKVDNDVANFTVPLCATVHLAGSTITIVSCTVAVMVLHSALAIPAFTTILPFILMLGIVMLAAPGVPGGAVMSAVGLLGSMLGFGETAVALMIALYMAQDSFGTACNITGDGAIAMFVDNSKESEQTNN